jgi:hypothetical protein
MKHLILIVAILSSMAQAQQSVPCLKLSKVKIDGKVLHQNSATRVDLAFEGKHCYVFNGAPDQARAWPDFDIPSAPGVSVEIGGTEAARFDQSTVSAGILRAQEVSVTLNVIAQPGLELGEHKLPGQVRYKVMDGLGNVSEETLAFEVPLKVDKPKTTPTANSYDKPGPDFFDRHPVWSKILIPFEIVAFIPLYLIDAIFLGWDGC